MEVWSTALTHPYFLLKLEASSGWWFRCCCACALSIWRDLGSFDKRFKPRSNCPQFHWALTEVCVIVGTPGKVDCFCYKDRHYGDRNIRFLGSLPWPAAAAESNAKPSKVQMRQNFHINFWNRQKTLIYFIKHTVKFEILKEVLAQPLNLGKRPLLACCWHLYTEVNNCTTRVQ